MRVFVSIGLVLFGITLFFGIASMSETPSEELSAKKAFVGWKIYYYKPYKYGTSTKPFIWKSKESPVITTSGLVRFVNIETGRTIHVTTHNLVIVEYK